MRISDWSSDVCSSDLSSKWPGQSSRWCRRAHFAQFGWRQDLIEAMGGSSVLRRLVAAHVRPRRYGDARSEERRVGTECVSTCRSRWSPYHYKIKPNIVHLDLTSKYLLSLRQPY